MIQALRKPVFTTLLALAVLSPLRAADGRIPISSVPFTISQPGVYTLTRDLSLASGNNIVIDAANVVVDLAGHTLTNTDAAGKVVAIAGANVRITNGRLVGGQSGISINTGATNAAFQLDHLAIRQSVFGIDVNSLTAAGTNARVVIEDNTLTEISFVAIKLYGVQHGRIERNLISRCNDGIRLDNSQFNRVAQNVLSSNQGSGFLLYPGSSHNSLDGNSAVGNGAAGFSLNNGGGVGNIYSNNRLSGNTGGNDFTSGVSAGGNNAGGANF